MVAGLEQPSQGTISQNGVLIRSLNEKAHVMFQDDRLLPWMTVRENLSFGNKSDKMTKEADELLKLVDLSDFADYYPAHLSGGKNSVWLWRVRLCITLNCCCLMNHFLVHLLIF